MSARPAAENAERLDRALGPWSAYAVVAGSMIGTGIFFFVSPVAQHVTSAPAILSVWVVGTAVATCGALCVAELAAAYPATGGVYVFLREAFGPLTAFLYAWANFLIMRIGSISITALAFAAFFSELLGLTQEDAASHSQVIAIAAVVAITLVNAMGVRSGGRLQVVLTFLKLLSLVAIVAIATAYATDLTIAHEVELEPWAGSPHRWGFAVALVPVMWTLGGWDESPLVAEEIHHPERNLPLSVLAGLWSVGALYVLVNAAYLVVLSPAELAGSGTLTATVVIERALGDSAASVLSLVLVISTLGAANGLTLTGARIAYAAGKDHRPIAWLAHVHPRTHAPVRALILQGALTVLAIVVLSDPYDLLLYTAVAYWGFAGLMAVAMIVLRRSDPQRTRPFRVPAYPIVPLAFVAAAAAMTLSVVGEDPGSAGATVAILVAGVLVYSLESFVTGSHRKA